MSSERPQLALAAFHFTNPAIPAVLLPSVAANPLMRAPPSRQGLHVALLGSTSDAAAIVATIATQLRFHVR